MVEEKPSSGLKRGEELNLIDMLVILLRHKTLLLCFAALALVSSIIYLHLPERKQGRLEGASVATPYVYYSECIIAPYAGSADAIVLLLSRRQNIRRISQNVGLLPLHQHDAGNIGSGVQDDSQRPSTEDALRQIEKNLSIQKQDGYLIISFMSSTNPSAPPQMIQGSLKYLSDHFREHHLSILSAQKKMFLKQMRLTSDSSVRARLSQEIVTIIEQEGRAQNNLYYGFYILDPPKDAEKVLEANLSTKSSQYLPDHRSGSVYVVLLIVMAAMVFAVAIAFFLEYIRAQKRDYPEKIEELKKSLGWKR